ncbi:class A sortase [Lacticaseibacillus jixiensis]|uniref:class A sortase n=1 Tax=Lacticaseibacillus jixiensis TaxID=3231926 RepID=UPI0036F2DDF3
MNKAKLKMLLTTIGLVVLAGALSLYLFQDQLSALLVRHNRIVVTTETVHAAKAKQQARPATYAFDDVKPLSLAQLSAATVAKHNIGAVGKIVMPQVGLNLPIALGVGNAELAFAAGTLIENQRMGQDNYALAGHHMAQDETVLFGPLVKSSVGMVAYVTDMNKIYAYQLYERRYIKATQVSVLDPTTQATLTLVTCDDDGAGRLLVRGRLVQTFSFNSAPSALKKLIDKPA